MSGEGVWGGWLFSVGQYNCFADAVSRTVLVESAWPPVRQSLQRHDIWLPKSGFDRKVVTVTVFSSHSATVRSRQVSEPWTGPSVQVQFRFEVKFPTWFSAQKHVPSYFWKFNNNPIYFKTLSRESRLDLEWSCLYDSWCILTVVSINRLECNFFGAWNYLKLTRTLNIISCILSPKFR